MLKIKIYTPLGLYYQSDCESLYLKTLTGYRTILSGHIDLLAALGEGNCVIQIANDKKQFLIFGGVFKLEKNQGTILAQSIYSKDELSLVDLETKLNKLHQNNDKSSEVNNHYNEEVRKLNMMINFVKNI